jgi:hypothetical protein
VTNGIAVRMALLYLLIAGAAEDGEPTVGAGAGAEETPAPRNRRSTDKKDPSHAAD